MSFSGTIDNARGRVFSIRPAPAGAAPTRSNGSTKRPAMNHVCDKLRHFWAKHFQELLVLAIWIISLLPGIIVSIRKGDPWHATVVVPIIQLLASLGSITLFGVLAQIVCYKHIESVEVHDRMMDGLFFGFHTGMMTTSAPVFRASA